MSTEFKLIVAGGREFNNYYRLCEELSGLANTTYKDKQVSIVSGMARGADALGVRFAKEFDVLLHEFPADWNTHGKRAGFMRNDDMSKFADGLLAFWDGQSRGTAHMIETMRKAGKPVHVVRY